MGLNYSYWYFMEVGQVSPTLELLLPNLDTHSRQKLRHSLPWHPVNETKIISRSGKETVFRCGIRPKPGFPAEWDDDEKEGWDQPRVEFMWNCFSLLVQKDGDEALSVYATEYPVPLGSDQTASIGCVWTHVVTGERYAVIQFTAATSDMSRLFERSQNIRAIFVNLAEKSKVLAMQLDTEDLDENYQAMAPDTFYNMAYLLYPEDRKIRWLGPDDFLAEPQSQQNSKLFSYDVDAMVLAFLQSAGLAT